MRHLSEVVDFEVLVERDDEVLEHQGGAALLVRDRELGLRLPERSPRRRLRAWVLHRRAVEPEDLPGDHARGLIALAAWVLGLLGILVGVSAATALLAYDGSTPVNVLAWLLYTAVIPLAFALVLVLGLVLPSRWFPRAGPAQALLGAVVEPLLRRLPKGERWARELFGRTGRATRALERWLLVALTQIFSLAFLIAALITLFVHVAITDLTFGWSTTLDIGAEAPELLRAVAAPWREVWPGAFPSADEAIWKSMYSRFVERFERTPTRAPVPAELSAMWWKYCAAALITYGILPRVLLLFFATWRWRRALSRWPALERPEVRALLDRLSDTGGAFTAQRIRSVVDAEPPRGTAAEPEVELSQAERRGEDLVPSTSNGGLVVAWGAAADDPEGAARALGALPERVLTAGASADLEAERSVLAAAAEWAGPVRVLMPLSEPPVEDVLGFLRELRAVVPRVVIVPLEPHGAGWRAAPVDAIWQKALAKVRGMEVHPQ